MEVQNYSLADIKEKVLGSMSPYWREWVERRFEECTRPKVLFPVISAIARMRAKAPIDETFAALATTLEKMRVDPLVVGFFRLMGVLGPDMIRIAMRLAAMVKPEESAFFSEQFKKYSDFQLRDAVYTAYEEELEDELEEELEAALKDDDDGTVVASGDHPDLVRRMGQEVPPEDRKRLLNSLRKLENDAASFEMSEEESAILQARLEKLGMKDSRLDQQSAIIKVASDILLVSLPEDKIDAIAAFGDQVRAAFETERELEAELDEVLALEG